MKEKIVIITNTLNRIELLISMLIVIGVLLFSMHFYQRKDYMSKQISIMSKQVEKQEETLKVLKNIESILMCDYVNKNKH